MDLSSSNITWKALPDMTGARSNFNPCLFNDYMYLCGDISVEVFFPETDSFLPLPLQLPEKFGCFVYVHNNCLVVHTKTFLTKFLAGQAGQLVPHSQVLCAKSEFLRSNILPVLGTNRQLVYLFQWDQCVSFSLRTGAQVQIPYRRLN